VARNDEAEPVTSAERARGSLRPWITGHPGQVAVRDDLAVPDSAKGSEDRKLERSPAVELQAHVLEGDPIAGEVAPDPVNQLIRFRDSAITPTPALSG
jgi:hypothetical protein